MPSLAYKISRMRKCDLDNGFLDCLSCLSHVGLTPDQALPIFWERQNHPYCTTLVARLADSQVIATGTILAERKYLHQGSLAGTIEDVAVLTQYQGVGVGTAIVQKLLQTAQNWGCYKVTLTCRPQLAHFYGSSVLKFGEGGVTMRFDLPQ